MEYKKTMHFGWTSDDGNKHIQIYKDNFFPEGAIMIRVGDYWAFNSPEGWIEALKKYRESSTFPIQIGRLGITNDLIVKYVGWKPLFWRFHWKLKGGN